MRPNDTDERHRALIASGVVVAIVTLAVWFAALAFLRWVPTRDVNTGLGPDFLYVVVLPLAMAGLAGLAASAAWRYQLALGADEDGPAWRRDARD